MRTPLVVIALLAAGPALAQQPGQPQLGARTQSPDSMAGALNRVSPEEEMRQLAAAADAHPLGSLENPVRVGGPEGERAYLGRLPAVGGVTVLDDGSLALILDIEGLLGSRVGQGAIV